MSDINIQIKNEDGDLLYPKTKGSLVYNNSNEALGTVAAGAQVNVIETVKVNGTALTPSDKAVDITIPTIDETTITKNDDDELQASSVLNARTGTDALPIWQGTSAQWTNGEPVNWYNWKTTGTVATNEITVGSATNFAQKVSYINGKFIYLTNGLNDENNVYFYYSDDGITWTKASTPVQAKSKWFDIAYGNGKYVAVGEYNIQNQIPCWSTDGINWEYSENSNLHTIVGGYGTASIVCVNNTFYVYATVARTPKCAYSTDGETWYAGTPLPFTSAYGNGYVTIYANGVVTVIQNNGNGVAYSTDCQTWNTSTMPSSQPWGSVAYGNGRYVAISGVSTSSNVAAYSTDGINWTQSTLPASRFWSSITFGDGKFVAVSTGISTTIAYSEDGIHWTTVNLPSAGYWGSVAYGSNKFVTVQDTSSTTSGLYFTIDYEKCYTDTSTPTTSSTVYSAPNTASSLTISSVGTSSITLSDSNVYNRNTRWDDVTYRTIGDAHPTWLCNVNEVGVKVGNTIIANNGGSGSSTWGSITGTLSNQTDLQTALNGKQTTSNLVTSISSSSTDTQYPSAKCMYDLIGTVETALHNINSGS